MDVFVVGIGIGGIIIGVGWELKCVYLKIELVGVELVEFVILEGKEVGFYKI